MHKQLINRVEDVVCESLDGLIATTPHITRLDGYPHIKVCYNSTHDGDKNVAIISGGGSGHEPAFAGFIGTGMLSAAIAGDVFAAPPEEAVLAAIRQVTGKKGCILIFNNYTGDRLCFGAATERAKAEGFQVEMVVVADDCALPDTTSVGRRGLAGSLFVMKVAGAAAAAGLDLAACLKVAEKACSSVGTLGVALTGCTLPGQKPSQRLGPDEIEMGMGLHGEPGYHLEKMRPVNGIVEDLVNKITESEENAYLPVRPGERVALLVDNFGGVTSLEMGVVGKAAVHAVVDQVGAALERVYIGTLMSSLDMKGFSISILKLGEDGDDTLVKYLDADTDSPGWPRHGGKYVEKKVFAAVPQGATDAPEAVQVDNSSSEAQLMQKCIEAACDALINAQGLLDELDGKVGDADCGSTLATGAHAVRAALPTIPLNDATATALGLARASGQVGGTSGGVLKLFFSGAAAALKEHESNEKSLTLATAAIALKAGVDVVSKYGRAQRGDRTTVDAWGPAADSLCASASAAASAVEAAFAAAKAAAEGAEATKSMAARAGRSTYVPNAKVQGVPDPGAVAVSIWMQAVAEALAN